MPDDKPQPNESPDSGGSDPGSPAPAYVTADQLNQAMTQLNQTFQAGLQAIAGARNADPMATHHPMPVNLPTDNEVLEEIQSGGMTKLKQLINSSVDKVRREELDPFRQNGIRVLGEQSKQLAILSGKMPYYQRFQKEIDTAIDRLPPEQRTSAEVYKGLHDIIVGQNFTILAKEQQEAQVRAARERDASTLPGSQGGRQAEKVDPNAIPSFESIYGKEGEAALANLGRGGRTPDGFAQTMGYKDWSTYYTEVLKPSGVTANG